MERRGSETFSLNALIGIVNRTEGAIAILVQNCCTRYKTRFVWEKARDGPKEKGEEGRRQSDGS